MPVSAMLPATPDNVNSISAWINSQEPGGRTRPSEALIQAFEQEPDVIWLLSDGEFSQRVPVGSGYESKPHSAHQHARFRYRMVFWQPLASSVGYGKRRFLYFDCHTQIALAVEPMWYRFLNFPLEIDEVKKEAPLVCASNLSSLYPFVFYAVSRLPDPGSVELCGWSALVFSAHLLVV